MHQNREKVKKEQKKISCTIRDLNPGLAMQKRTRSTHRATRATLKIRVEIFLLILTLGFLQNFNCN